MKEFIFIGTYSEPIKFGTGQVLQGQGKGIYVYSFDPETGIIFSGELAQESRNPSFLSLSKDRRYLYAVNELKEFDGEASGGVSAFRIDEQSGRPILNFLNCQLTKGTDPCHVNINRLGTQVYVANFMSGSVSVYPVEQNGKLLPCSHFIQHEGKSIDPRRQTGPHAHSVVLTPDERFALVPDLGIDKLMVYNTDFENGRLTPAKTPFVRLSPGDGPRYCEFHPDGKRSYLINELASSLSVLCYHNSGEFIREQVISTIPDGFTKDNICADVHILPNGRFLYASNRGHDSIAIFSVGEEDGRLTLIDIISCGGKTPRNFTVSKCGNYLLVANQDSDNLVSFSINEETGLLNKVCEVYAPTPVCVIPY